MIFSSFSASRVKVNLLSFNSSTDQGELAMQRGLGTAAFEWETSHSKRALAFPHERLHQDAMKWCND